MCSQLDLLVAPLGGTVVARDDGRAMDAPEVTQHERVARLCPVGRAARQAQVPRGVLVPCVPREEPVLILRGGLDVDTYARRS